MIAKEYEYALKDKLNPAQYLLLILLVGCLQKLQDMRLERIAEALPIPILKIGRAHV